MKKSDLKEKKSIIFLLILIILTSIVGILWILTPKSIEPINETEPICINQCGDGICQEIVCLGEGCPCKEDKNNCPEDCKKIQEWPYKPYCYYDEYDDTTSCENGIIRIRPTKAGIIWFDFYNKKEEKWYLNKNNLNLVTKVKGSEEWQNTELEEVQPTVEIISESESEIKLRYYFNFPNGAKIKIDTSMKKGDSYLNFKVNKEKDSKQIDGFQWHITFGQAEAVNKLNFDDHNIFVNDLPEPFPGGRLELQHIEWFTNLKELDFKFKGSETEKRDPNNPPWMGRVLGLTQNVIWEKPMNPQDHFAFEARDQPWQPDWKVPSKAPWIEGLWFIRNGNFESDELTYGIENWEEYS